MTLEDTSDMGGSLANTVRPYQLGHQTLKQDDDEAHWAMIQALQVAIPND